MKLIDTLNAKFIESLKAEGSRLALAVKQGKIRIDREVDDFCSISDIMGDIFGEDHQSPEHHKEKAQFKRRIYNQKIWIYSVSFWNGREWVDSDCIGGFIGFDFFGSNYDVDLAEMALEAYEGQDLDDQGFVIDPYRVAA